MNAEIIAVGTELLLGHVINTNASFLSKKLAELGISVYHHTTVGDNRARLAAAIRAACARADIVVISGGLGPTVDDITREVIVETCGGQSSLNRAVYVQIKRYFRKRGLKKVPRDVKKQAYIPKRATCFLNSIGSAPGFCLSSGKTQIIALPGPPRELEPMFTRQVVPHLKKQMPRGTGVIKTYSIRTSGLGEALVNRKVKDLLASSGSTTLGIYTEPGIVDLKITVKAKNIKRADTAIRRFEKKISRKLARYIFGTGDDKLEHCIGRLLKQSHKTIAVAESCTGGLLGHRMTNVPGSSGYFKGGVLAYANRMKQDLLGVPAGVLAKKGAVSSAVCTLMAQGVRKGLDADVGVGITGIAGPGGGTRAKPVGLVFIAVRDRRGTLVKEWRFKGSRKDIKEQTVTRALGMVWERIR